MSDQDNNNNDVNSKYPHLSPELAEKADKAIEKRNNVRAIKSLSPADSKWTIIQDIMQEIVATYTVQNPDSLPKSKQLVEDLHNEIKSRYENDEVTRELLIKAIPSDVSVRAWFKSEGWEEAVWEKAKASGLFTKERRASMISALYTRGVTKSDVAAKMYLTMSGDYSERADGEKDRVADTFREINKLLHKKNG